MSDLIQPPPNNGLHQTRRAGWANVTFGFHDTDETGGRMLSKIAKTTGLTPEDL